MRVDPLRGATPTDHPDLVQWALWSRNRKEEIEGVYSHQTALSLHDLSDLNPAKLHMTVPSYFRRNSEIPGVITLHYSDISPKDIQTAPGIRFTRPLRTVVDLLKEDSVGRNILRQAVRQALDRGLITRQEIRRAKLDESALAFLNAALHQVA